MAWVRCLGLSPLAGGAGSRLRAPCLCRPAGSGSGSGWMKMRGVGMRMRMRMGAAWAVETTTTTSTYAPPAPRGPPVSRRMSRESHPSTAASTLSAHVVLHAAFLVMMRVTPVRLSPLVVVVFSRVRGRVTYRNFRDCVKKSIRRRRSIPREIQASCSPPGLESGFCGMPPLESVGLVVSVPPCRVSRRELGRRI